MMKQEVNERIQPLEEKNHYEQQYFQAIWPWIRSGQSNEEISNIL